MLRADQCRFCNTAVARAVGDSAGAPQAFHQCRNVVLDVVSAVYPSIVNRVHQLNKRGLRKICAAVKRFCLRRKKYGHWPATATSHGLNGVHVNGVDVRSFLAVNFDIDKQLVHERSGFDIFETFVGHYVAPVTRRVPNRKKYWLAASAGESKRIFSPRIPIDRIVAMLAKVRADFVTEAIGHVRKS